MAHGFSPPDICPVCGEVVPPKARACPGCGADERAGWDEDAQVYDALDLPDPSYDRGKFLEEEFGTPRRRPAKAKFWSAVGLLTLAAVISDLLRR